MILKLMFNNEKLIVALTNRLSLNFSNVERNVKILRTVFPLVLISTSPMKHHSILDRFSAF